MDFALGDAKFSVNCGMPRSTPIQHFRMPPLVPFVPLVLLVLLVLSVPFNAHAQWQPPANLRQIPIKYDCRKTQHRVGAALQPNPFCWHGAIFLCLERMRAIDAKHPGAARFFLVHEYGHLALRAEDEGAADEWAAKQLAAIPSERQTLLAAIAHFLDDADVFDPLYGTGLNRARRIALAANLSVPRARSVSSSR
jgi:hypothetical protein